MCVVYVCCVVRVAKHASCGVNGGTLCMFCCADLYCAMHMYDVV